ncbi:polysaccharide deacetylase family protein [Micromonospora sp. DR5-3]|uniref:polysaccharide deacetylase family protein n=1 Tax=unclassified Micromonospora TaxID=2617518 RepID=UPI0011DA03C8|nr:MULTISPECIES: polysaccharide deacetylase family protein [unclassified Micromonospora]MCW3820805.1 polysaccharide deacetylase family protein [Micromonospora sp. DR5-3]TYC24102.1 polysaccharide deacetylase family protein [Micromonospora sp. MP36]
MADGVSRWDRRAVLRRTALLAGGAALGAAGTSQTTWIADRRLPIAGGPASATLGSRHQEVGSGAVEVVWGVRTTERLIALTFDDGPLPQWTPMVLDTLEKYAVPATFFLVGVRAREHAALVRGRLGRHEVGNHSWAHHDLARMDAHTAYDDLRRSHEAIVQATGVAPRLIRPPWGHLGGAVLHAAARLDYRLVLWTLQMVEGEFPNDPAGHARRIVADVQPGTILLGHDVGTQRRLVALRGLPDMINGLRARGYTFVTVSQLLRHAAVV